MNDLKQRFKNVLEDYMALTLVDKVADELLALLPTYVVEEPCKNRPGDGGVDKCEEAGCSNLSTCHGSGTVTRPLTAEEVAEWVEGMRAGLEIVESETAIRSLAELSNLANDALLWKGGRVRRERT